MFASLNFGFISKWFSSPWAPRLSLTVGLSTSCIASTQQLVVRVVNYGRYTCTSFFCSCVAVAIISYGRIASPVLWEFFACWLKPACSLVDTCSRKSAQHAGIHDYLFVATNVDRSSCVHVAVDAWQQ